MLFRLIKYFYDTSRITRHDIKVLRYRSRQAANEDDGSAPGLTAKEFFA
jgi:hypothetical protein